MDLNLKNLNNLPWYGQLGLFAMFGVIIVGLGWYFFISGPAEQITVKQSQLDGLKVDIQRGQAVEQKHQEFMTQNKQLLSKLATLKIILPEAKQTDELLREIQAAALSSSLVIKRFQPLPVVEKDFFSEWPINLEVEGSYHNLAIFFDRLSKFSRIVNVSDLKIVENRRGGSSIIATCVATTFVYNQEKENLDNPAAQQAGSAKK
ncbi:MAG: type 4a pilus biogenesis protein PilO [Acidobacteriota bacterium]